MAEFWQAAGYYAEIPDSGALPRERDVLAGAGRHPARRTGAAAMPGDGRPLAPDSACEKMPRVSGVMQCRGAAREREPPPSSASRRITRTFSGNPSRSPRILLPFIPIVAEVKDPTAMRTRQHIPTHLLGYAGGGSPLRHARDTADGCGLFSSCPAFAQRFRQAPVAVRPCRPAWRCSRPCRQPGTPPGRPSWRGR